MEKNTLFAVALSFGILLLWTTIFPPQPPPKPIEVTARPYPISPEQDPMIAKLEKGATVIEEESGIGNTNTVAPDLLAKIIQVETDYLRVRIDSRGGVVKSLQLKNYKHFKKSISLADWFPILESVLGQGNPEKTEDNLVQMINNQVKGIDPFSIHFDKDSKKNKQFQQAVYASNLDQLTVTDGRQPDRLILTSPVIDGLQLIKTFEFLPGTYLIQYKVQIINRSDAVQSLNIQHQFGEGRIPDATAQMRAHTGAIYFFDGSVEIEDTSDLEEQEFRVFDIDWLGLEDQYFITAVAPLTPIKYGAFQAFPYFQGRESELAPTFSVRLPPVDLQPHKQIESQFEVYYGPKEEQATSKFGRQLILSQQMLLEAVAKPLMILLRWINGYVGNYGVAIILLTIIVRVTLFPLTLKGMKSMKRMQQLQPKMKKLQEKYKGNKEKLNVEMMGLYKKHKVNPLGGCVPLILQIPIFLGLYSALSAAVELRHTPFYGYLTDLSAPDGLGITPLLMGATMFLQQKMTPQTMMDPTQAKIMGMLPIIFTFFTFTFPSGLLLYWVTSNILSIAQQYIINKTKEPEPST